MCFYVIRCGGKRINVLRISTSCTFEMIFVNDLTPTKVILSSFMLQIKRYLMVEQISYLDLHNFVINDPSFFTEL